MYVVPLWMFLAALGITLALSAAIHGIVFYKYRDLDKEARTLYVAIGQHKGKVEENTFTMKALIRTLDQLFGKPINGG